MTLAMNGWMVAWQQLAGSCIITCLHAW
jgi:hypothetical protein